MRHGEFHCTDISQTKQAAMEQKISKKATPLEINGVRFLQDGWILSNREWQ